MVSIEDVTEALENTRVTISGVSFAGKSLKLDSENDGNFIYLDVQFLGNALVTAGARLTELDLSDNAFGPIGVEGLASLLRSSSCYGLEELRLNNNGLGIGGGKLLAKALLDCYECSKSEGKPLALKVFIAGRNRLENDGAKALAEVFNTIGTLEEIAMPQNDGALELIAALANKSQLKALVLDGNNFGSDGKEAVRKKMMEIGKLNALGSLNDDESADSEDEEDTEEEQYQDDDGDDSEEIETKNESLEDEKIILLQNNSHNQSRDDVEIFGNLSLNEKTVVVADFLNKPNADNFIALGPNVSSLLLSEAEKSNENQLEKLTEMLMKVGSLNVAIKGEENIQSVLKCTELLFEELVKRSQNSDSLSIMNNFLLVYLGFIKSEDKKFKPTWNIDGCLIALHNVVKKNYMPESTKNTLKVFIQKEVTNSKDHLDLKKSILLDLK
ncbi:ran gtpase-activating protein 1 [Holotrichia oblita]|uniref:Ran gtpase-activating protein 1 n=1 Tax=Holotrichia oblita TaxID=644536 RepID=A0ACB9TYC3_HOLOL|nr:ran gtpase-activating protein 1 [Holotrichia oblita]